MSVLHQTWILNTVSLHVAYMHMHAYYLSSSSALSIQLGCYRVYENSTHIRWRAVAEPSGGTGISIHSKGTNESGIISHDSRLNENSPQLWPIIFSVHAHCKEFGKKKVYLVCNYIICNYNECYFSQHYCIFFFVNSSNAMLFSSINCNLSIGKHYYNITGVIF